MFLRKIYDIIFRKKEKIMAVPVSDGEKKKFFILAPYDKFENVFDFETFKKEFQGFPKNSKKLFQSYEFQPLTANQKPVKMNIYKCSIPLQETRDTIRTDFEMKIRHRYILDGVSRGSLEPPIIQYHLRGLHFKLNPLYSIHHILPIEFGGINAYSNFFIIEEHFHVAIHRKFYNLIRKDINSKEKSQCYILLPANLPPVLHYEDMSLLLSPKEIENVNKRKRMYETLPADMREHGRKIIKEWKEKTPQEQERKRLYCKKRALEICLYGELEQEKLERQEAIILEREAAMKRKCRVERNVGRKPLRGGRGGRCRC